jgi:hypothetical protein
MAEAKSKLAWACTSAAMALLANLHRDPKRTRAFTPRDFDPHARTRTAETPAPRVGVEVLKEVFIDRRGGDAKGG